MGSGCGRRRAGCFPENDDREPGAHPVAVLSGDYWRRRFGRDPSVVGRSVRIGDQLFEIAGVVDGPFTGTEPGTVTDIFLPAMMHPGASRDDWTWHRTFALIPPGAARERIRAKLDATSRAFERERARGSEECRQRRSKESWRRRLSWSRPPRAHRNCRRTIEKRWLRWESWWAWCC